MTLMEGLAALASQPTAWVAVATLVAMEVVPREALDDLGQHQRRTITAWTRLPSVSVRMQRLRPFIFLPAS